MHQPRPQWDHLGISSRPLGFLHGLELLDPFDQFVLCLAWNLVGAFLNRAPHKKVYRIHVRPVRRPNVRGEKINKVIAQPKLYFFDVWQGAESCCRTYGLPAATLRIQSSKCISKTCRYSTVLTIKPFGKMYGGMT